MKLKIKAIIYATTVVLAVTICAVYFASLTQPEPIIGDEFPSQSQQTQTYASSTVYSIVFGASQRVLATSTYESATGLLPETSGRSGVTFQAINCATNGNVWVRFNDLAAATSTGYFVGASSTATLGDSIPNIYGSIRAFASGGNCSLIVTEYRTRF